jgi:ankyrin repeat protein
MRIYLRIVAYVILASLFSAASAGAQEDFFRAVNVDNANTVSRLLAQGFDPNTVDEHGQVGLYLALRSESTKVVAALLAQPAIQIDLANGQGETPLMMAALRGQLEWAQRLVERGAALQRAGWTPLHYAASGPSTEVVAFLLDRGAPIDAASPNRTTPLMMAARYGPETSAQLLVSRGADPKLRNDKGLNAADFAHLGGRETLAARLDALAR